MNATLFASLLGGLGLFLLGMRMITDGLKLAAGNALRSILHSWTQTNVRGFFAGILITALVQSSAAVTVAIVGFVNAELLSLAQAVWVVFGANLGSTMTAWLVALVGVSVDVGALALPLVGVGMLLRLANRTNVRGGALGETIAGFGAFFLGIGILQGTFGTLATDFGDWPQQLPEWAGVPAFVAIGMLLTILAQSSSAAIAIALTASASGTLPLELAAPAVVGANIGTTSAALFATFGATAPAKRVAWAHIGFNLLTGAAALTMLPILLSVSTSITALWNAAGNASVVLAVFHTLFNLLGVALMWPLARRLVDFLSRRFVSADEKLGQPLHFDPTLAEVPSLALRGLVLEIARMCRIAFELAEKRVSGVATEPESRQTQEGIVRLGQAVRGFMATMSKGTLPDDVAAALPHLLRATHHIEDVAIDSSLIAGVRAYTRQAAAAHAAGASRDWAVLRAAVLESLRAFPPGRDDASGTGNAIVHESDTTEPEAQPAERDRRLELAYEALKAHLLREGALGRLPVDAMEEDLLKARRLRRLAESAMKARNRLEPWLGQVDGLAPVSDALHAREASTSAQLESAGEPLSRSVERRRHTAAAPRS